MKKRKLRVDRLLILIGITFCVIYSCVSITSSVVNFVKEEQLKNRARVNITERPIQLTGGQEIISTIPEGVCVLEEIPEPEEPKLTYIGNFLLTGYCNCEICCGQWAGGPCANGEMPKSEWTIAVDPDIIPLGSHVMINGHEYKACDTGSAIHQNHIDVYCDTHSECFSDFCNGYADVYLIEG